MENSVFLGHTQAHQVQVLHRLMSLRQCRKVTRRVAAKERKSPSEQASILLANRLAGTGFRARVSREISVLSSTVLKWEDVAEGSVVLMWLPRSLRCAF